MEKWLYIRDELQYSVYFWIINTHESDIRKLLYGFACPIVGELPINRWFSSKVETNTSIKADIIRLSFYTKGKNIKDFADMLTKGHSLEEISLKLCISNIQEEYKDLSLISEDYRYRPPIFLETKQSISYNKRILQPISSMAKNPMICETIVLINKEGLFELDEKMELRELMDMIKKSLVNEISLDIPGPDAERLGNFELLSFPYESNKDISPIETEVIREDEDLLGVRAVKISIKPNKFESSIYLRCRVRNGNVIIGDQIRLIEDASRPRDIKINILESCSDIEVSIWDADEDQNRPISLLYEYRVPLMRTIHTTMGINSIQGTLETKWTKKLSKKSNGGKIYNKFNRFSRSHFEVGGYKDDPWVPAGRAITDLFYDNYPKKSEAKFFRKGWQDENRFIDWLQHISGTNHAHRVVLIDPYFDTEAISKFLALVKYGDISYEVITDLAFREKAAEQIIKACEKMKMIIPDNTKIYGLSRKNKGTDQIFHDRFLVLFGKSKIPKVYMLSNSISGVAKNFSSAVVPVQPDVAEQIVEYYLDLISGSEFEDISKVDVNILWPIEKDDGDMENKNRKQSIGKVNVFPGFEELSEALFGSVDVPAHQRDERGRLQIPQEGKERSKQLDHIGRKLNSLFLEDEFNKALKLWSGIANWSVRIPDNDRDKMFEWFNSSDYIEEFIDIAEQCILKSIKMDYPLGVLNMDYNVETISVASQAFVPFSDLRSIAHSLIQYHFESDHPPVYSVSVAFEFLMNYAPARAFNALNSVLEDIGEEDKKLATASILPYYKVISISLHMLAFKLVMHRSYNDLSLVKIGLQCQIPIVRAMCIATIGYYVNKQDFQSHNVSYKKNIDLLDCLNDSKERVHGLSWIAYDCQVLRNQSNDNTMAADIMEYIKVKIVENCTEITEDISVLRSILKNISGPHEGAHSEDICDILMRLLDNKKVDEQTVTQYFILIFSEKLLNHLEDKDRYYKNVDLSFTHNAVNCLSTISSESCRSLLDELAIIVNRAGRKIIKPFARSRSYTDWCNAVEVLCWCGIVISNVYTNIKNDSKKINEVFYDIYFSINQYIGDFSDNSGLLDTFLKESNDAGLLEKGRPRA